MPFIDSLVEALHTAHIPNINTALQVFHSVEVPPNAGAHYLGHLKSNSPQLASALGPDGEKELCDSIEALCRVIKVLNKCMPNFPFGRALGYMAFVADQKAAREAQETLFDRVVEDYFQPIAHPDADREVVDKNRLEMIREMIVSVDKAPA